MLCTAERHHGKHSATTNAALWLPTINIHFLVHVSTNDLYTELFVDLVMSVVVALNSTDIFTPVWGIVTFKGDNFHICGGLHGRGGAFLIDPQ